MHCSIWPRLRLAALLWAGQLPQLKVIVLGLVTSFAAYTAVYALNDLVDCRRDARRAAGCADPDADLDAAMQLHPIAQGCLSFRAGFAWTLFWGVVASVGSYLLNPVCLIMFLGACLFEAAYCALGGVTPLRTLIAGVVKSAGPLAAIIAVDPAPSIGRFLLFLTWLFLWEIGGQNIPNDLADVAEDQPARVPDGPGLNWTRRRRGNHVRRADCHGTAQPVSLSGCRDNRRYSVCTAYCDDWSRTSVAPRVSAIRGCRPPQRALSFQPGQLLSAQPSGPDNGTDYVAPVRSGPVLALIRKFTISEKVCLKFSHEI